MTRRPGGQPGFSGPANLAACYAGAGDPVKAEETYRRGTVPQAPGGTQAVREAAVAVDRGFSGYYVKERFGAFLSAKGRYRESLAVYQEVSRAPDLDDADRGRIQANIEYLESKIGLEGKFDQRGIG
ncbi:MAG: hypothetical protein K2X35_05560 [Bryobacteraceae bacterium]|nr:hypothetical protein [Bryobacteraceae bacterium]